MTKKFTYTAKSNGDTLTAAEWNNLAQDVDAAVDAINNGGAGSGNSTPVAIDASGVISVNSKGNTTLSATKHVNIEPAYVANGGEGTYGDVQIKPGDDITLESHHRASDKRDEITVKTSNGQDDKAPVKLQVIASGMTLSTKGKQVESGSNDATNVMNINVTTGEGKGYLKVRAQAIDLRCEEHGGIALQPKGKDGQNHMNKIKFEHGGGDGLEFATFNTEKTSIFTDEYRFNREGVWKMATRTKVVSDKVDANDDTTAYKYVKAADDFYDNIALTDEQCTTKDIIKTAYAMNGGKDRHTKITNKGAIEIATNPTYSITIESTPADPSTAVNINTIAKTPDEFSTVAGGDVFNEGDFNVLPTVDSVVYTNDTQYFSFTENVAPNIKIESGGELKLGGILDFGSSFNFGETDNGIETQYKLTKKNATKDCGVLKVIGVNNNTSNDLTVTNIDPSDGVIADYVIPHETTDTPVIASCSINDIIMFINWAKYNQQGPWAASAISGKKTMTYNQGNGLTAGHWLSNQMVNPGEPA